MRTDVGTQALVQRVESPIRLQQQFQSAEGNKEFNDLKDLAVDEGNKKVYLVGPEKVYVYNLTDAPPVAPVAPATTPGSQTAPAGTPAAPMMRIEELDVRASAGSGSSGLTDENSRTVAAWQIPNEIVRGYTTAPAAELRIITVLGDSMEPALLPGQRVLVDTADRRPSPPGVFVVWDGLGLVVKRVQLLPHTDPPRVKITSDNQNYEPYERTLDEAYIQGRVIGQWRWL